MKKTAVNLITGPLGAGKTSLIRHCLQTKPNNQNWGILVNEFGAIGIDGVIFAPQPGLVIHQIPGGCICCSAKNELHDTLKQLSSLSLDRLIIEPTGLGEPDSLADLFLNAELQAQYQLQSLISVLDCAHTQLEDLSALTSWKNLLNMADVLVLNKRDLASDEKVAQLVNHSEQLYPPKVAIVTCQQGQLDPQYLEFPHQPQFQAEKHIIWTPASFSLSPLKQPHKPTLPPQSTILFNNLIDRYYYQQSPMQSFGWLFNSEQMFNWKTLEMLFQSLNQTLGLQGVKRAKGVFRVGQSWMLFQWVHQQTQREIIAYRKDSRLELLVDNQADFDLETFEALLQQSMS